MRKFFTGKAVLILVALLLATGGVGGAFAAWTDSISIKGTVQTATIDWEVVGEPEPSLIDETAWALCLEECACCFGEGLPGWGKWFPYKVGADDVEKDFVAGQHYKIGKVKVATIDNSKLMVEYEIDGDHQDWEITQTHLYVGLAPPSGGIGLFPYKSEKDDDVVDARTKHYHKYVIPLDDLGAAMDDILYIAAHADVERPEAPPGVDVETNGRMLVITVPCTDTDYNFLVTFEVSNTGTVPIRISDVTYELEEGVEGVAVELETTRVRGEQLHEPETVVYGQFRVYVEACEVGISKTVYVTVEAVQWNLYS